jgi:hypothetical protein
MRRINVLFKRGIKENVELASLLNQADSLSATQKIWNTVIPEALIPYTRAGTVNHKRLTVYIDSGAVAAKIKLLLPSLLVKLQKQGLEITSIRVQMQVKSSPRKTVKPTRHISQAASATLGELADKLSGSALGDALDKLSRHT